LNTAKRPAAARSGGETVALKDMFGFLDGGLESVFRRDFVDAESAREHVLRGIQRTRDDLGRGERLDGSRWVAVSNGVVAFTPTRPDGGPIEINGQTTNFIAEERFGDFLTHFADAVKAGDFDHALTTNGIGTAQHVSDAPVH
jgi:hypothetical protein